MDTNTRDTPDELGGEQFAALIDAAWPPRAAPARPGRPRRKPSPGQGRGRARRGERIPALPAGMDHLMPPMRLDTDPPWQPPPGPDHSFGVYDRQGRPVGAQTEQWTAALDRAERDFRVARTVLYRAGGRMTVSTVFLGVDMAGRDGPPVLWETMIFLGATLRDPAYCRRYQSETAAAFGHALTVYAIRVLRQGERGPRRVRPQTPGARAWRHTRRPRRRHTR